MREHNASLAKTAAPGRLVDPGEHQRALQIIQAVVTERIEPLEAKMDRIAVLERQVATLLGERDALYVPKHIGFGKWVVNDAAGAVNDTPLTKEAATWLAGELNGIGSGAKKDDIATLAHLAVRKSEGNGKAA